MKTANKESKKVKALRKQMKLWFELKHYVWYMQARIALARELMRDN